MCETDNRSRRYVIGTIWMTLRLIQAALLLVLASCSASAPSRAVASDVPFKVTEVGKFDDPWAMDFLPGSGIRMTAAALVTEKSGRLWLFNTANGQKQSVAGVPKVVAYGQGGLLDIRASPGFAGNRLVYLTYAEPSASGGSALALARAQLDIDAVGARLSGLQVIWRDPAGGRGGQFGAIIAFAPDGKSLFLSSGDRQRMVPAQDPDQPLGKILHLTLDGQPDLGGALVDERLGARTVTIIDPPEDTEEAKRARGRNFTWPGPNHTPAETWSTGHRNPYGLAFAPDGRLWETEMGPRGGDELNLIVQGKNYGWPLVSEGKNYNGVPIPPHSTLHDIVPPKLSWVPSISPTSLMFYSGKLFPQWKGNGFIGALSGEALIRVVIDGENARKADQWDMGTRIRFVGEGPDGAIYLLCDEPDGRMLKLTP